MGNNRYSIESIEKSNKVTQLNQSNQLNGRTNNLSVKERDYMISQAMKRLTISTQWAGTVKKAANYLDGVRFWELVDMSESKFKPANYFIFCANKELAKSHA